jgi:hypothetical protein
MTDPAVGAAFEAGQVPAGITAAYLDQTRDQPAIVAIIFVTAFTSIIVIMRCLARFFILKRFGLDDGLALLSWVKTNECQL